MNEKCPLCRQWYDGKNNLKTKHHLYPKVWYPDSNTIVFICWSCHAEFNHLYPQGGKRRWSKLECVKNFINFCSTKKRKVFKVYPILKHELLKQ